MGTLHLGALLAKQVVGKPKVQCEVGCCLYRSTSFWFVFFFLSSFFFFLVFNGEE